MECRSPLLRDTGIALRPDQFQRTAANEISLFESGELRKRWIHVAHAQLVGTRDNRNGDRHRIECPMYRRVRGLRVGGLHRLWVRIAMG